MSLSSSSSRSSSELSPMLLSRLSIMLIPFCASIPISPKMRAFPSSSIAGSTGGSYTFVFGIFVTSQTTVTESPNFSRVMGLTKQSLLTITLLSGLAATLNLYTNCVYSSGCNYYSITCISPVVTFNKWGAQGQGCFDTFLMCHMIGCSVLAFAWILMSSSLTALAILFLNLGITMDSPKDNPCKIDYWSAADCIIMDDYICYESCKD